MIERFPPSETAAIDLSAVGRNFGLVPAIAGVHLKVERGECLLIGGPNGAGKSTLLRIIATALSPTAGKGRILGWDLLRERQQIRARVDLLGHRTRLYEDLTAKENLRFAAVLSGADSRLVPRVLESVGLADVADERVRGFSHGMRQRVALARLHLRDPELVLLDEPYAGLDAEAKILVDQLVVQTRAKGRTVVMVTHDGSRTGLASRVAVMRAGRLSTVDRLAEPLRSGGGTA